MIYFEFIFGIVLVVVAVICLVISVAEEPGALVFVALAATGAGFLLSAGVHREWHHGQVEHLAIYRDAIRQGYPIRSSDVHQGYGATIDIRAGRCVFALDVRKVGGRWRFGVPESGRDSTGGIVFLSPADVAKLRAVCP